MDARKLIAAAALVAIPVTTGVYSSRGGTPVDSQSILNVEAPVASTAHFEQVFGISGYWAGAMDVGATIAYGAVVADTGGIALIGAGAVTAYTWE